MAFDYDPQRIPYYKKGSVDKKPPFRATGRGLNVDKPSFKADEFNSNAVLTASIEAPEGASYLAKFYLFVTRISTGWSLAGETGQALSSRAFYPRNLSQSELLIEGICPSQHEYDKLVEFVQAHHLRIVGNEAAAEIYDDTPNQTSSVNFRMARPGNRAGTYRHAPKIDWDVAITNIAAGHERFVHAPTFQLVCKVLNDRRQPSRDVEFSIMRDLDYQQVFGDLFNPLPAGAIQITGQLEQSTQSKLTLSTGGGITDSHDRRGLDQSPGSPPDERWVGPIAARAEGLSNPSAGDPIKKQFSNCIPDTPGKQYMAYDGISKGNGPHGVEIVDGNKIRVKYRDPPGAGNTLEVEVPL